jgi:hypothetical protein
MAKKESESATVAGKIDVQQIKRKHQIDEAAQGESGMRKSGYVTRVLNGIVQGSAIGVCMNRIPSPLPAREIEERKRVKRQKREERNKLRAEGKPTKKKHLAALLPDGGKDADEPEAVVCGIDASEQVRQASWSTLRPAYAGEAYQARGVLSCQAVDHLDSCTGA